MQAAAPLNSLASGGAQWGLTAMPTGLQLCPSVHRAGCHGLLSQLEVPTRCPPNPETTRPQVGEGRPGMSGFTEAYEGRRQAVPSPQPPSDVSILPTSPPAFFFQPKHKAVALKPSETTLVGEASPSVGSLISCLSSHSTLQP